MATVNSTFDDHLRELQSVSSQSPVVAFFDLDRTLIDGYSLTALAWQQIFTGQMSIGRFVKLGKMFLKYAIGRIDYNQMLGATVEDIRGMSEESLYALGMEAFQARLASWMYAEGYKLVASHQAQGHEVVMATSATRYQAQPVAQALGIEHIACTQLEIVDGCVAGGVMSCYGAGKFEAAREIAGQLHADLAQCFFYSDSSEDLPLLEAVGTPVIVNGRAKMRNLAAERGWRSLTLHETGSALPMHKLIRPN